MSVDGEFSDISVDMAGAVSKDSVDKEWREVYSEKNPELAAALVSVLDAPQMISPVRTKEKIISLSSKKDVMQPESKENIEKKSGITEKIRKIFILVSIISASALSVLLLSGIVAVSAANSGIDADRFR